jgi:tetratricopeptide (TPR) repeat protein
VKLEPDFAPAWQALGMRYYDYGTYSDGGEPARQQSLAAHRKAYQLDPNMIGAAQNIITHRTESGDLAGAYEEARALLEKFGSTAETQYAIAYVYRYGGLLEEAQRHCELALNHDPQNPRLRACGNPFMYAGEHTRAREFFKLDDGSYFSNWATVLSALRVNDTELALKVTRQAADDVTRGLMQPCLEGARGAALDANVAEFIKDWERSGDPEAHYAIMPMLAYCGRMPEALRFVERAVDGGFCSYPALEQEALLKPLRDDPEFQRIRGKAIACHEKFRAAVQDAV